MFESIYLIVSKLSMSISFCHAQPSYILMSFKLRFSSIYHKFVAVFAIHLPRALTIPLLSSQHSQNGIFFLSCSSCVLANITFSTAVHRSQISLSLKEIEAGIIPRNISATKSLDWMSDIALEKCPATSQWSSCWIMGEFSEALQGMVRGAESSQERVVI